MLVRLFCLLHIVKYGLKLVLFILINNVGMKTLFQNLVSDLEPCLLLLPVLNLQFLLEKL